MGPLGFLLLGFAPGIFWLWQIYRRNQYRPDSKDLVVRTFLLGLAAAVPVVFLEMMMSGPDSHQATAGAMDPAAAAFMAFGVAGLVEEIGKFFVVRASLYRSPYFDEPLRGLVYSSAAALGFASIENLCYMLQHGVEVIALRAILSTPGHVMFSALWGYSLGAAKVREAHGRSGTEVMVAGLVLAIALHGGFDYFLFIGEAQWTLLLFMGGLMTFVGLVRAALRASQHKERQAIPLRPCSACGAVLPLEGRFCPACGAGQAKVTPRCSKCRQGRPRRTAQHSGERPVQDLLSLGWTGRS